MVWVMAWGSESVFGPVDVAHVAGGLEGGVEGHGGFEGVGCLTALAQTEVFVEQRAVHGVSAVVDDLLGALHGVEAADVGNALVGDDDVDAVLGVVNV